MATQTFIVVLDGATARTETGCTHGVAWFVQQLGLAVSARATDHQRSLSAAVAESIASVAELHSQCDLSHPGTPSAAAGIVRVAGEVVEHFVLGDVSVVLDTGRTVRAITDDRVSLTASAERAEADRYPIGTPGKQAALLRMKHGELAGRNQAGGYWVAETDPGVVTHALTGSTPAREVNRIAVLTDGAARAVTFGLYDWPGALRLMEQAGPSGLVRRVRVAELQDPEGIRWPRNKRSDDATAVFAQLHTER